MHVHLAVVAEAESGTTIDGLESLLVVCAVAAVAPIVGRLLPGSAPQVVVLLFGGIIIGPEVLGLADPEPVTLFANVGLGFLFLLAG